MPAYYNEIDPYAAQWLRNLIAAGHIAPGDVDERSIAEVQPDDLRGYNQVHFFAGIGGWSRAARLAGLADSARLWTGSCPCQPFSAAGKQKGTTDERHLWPVMRDLIAQCRPAVVFGEQVASRLGRDWLGGVRADLEALEYAVAAADLCAAGVGAPHIRQRLFWVAGRDGGRQQELAQRDGRQDAWIEASRRHDAVGCGADGRVADANEGQRGRLADGEGRHLDRQAAGRVKGDGVAQPGGDLGRLADSAADGRREERALAGRLAEGDRPEGRAAGPVPGGDAGRLGHADDAGPQGRHDGPGEGGRADQRVGGATGIAGFWSDAIIIPCSDGKARRAEPGIFPLAHGVPGRVGRLRGYGNAIVPPLAATFIQAFLECSP